MKIFVCIFFFLGIISCGVSDKNFNIAKDSADKYYLYFNENDVKIKSLFSERFYRKTDENTLLDVINQLKKDYGNIKVAELVNKEVTNSLEYNKKETKLEITFHVVYDSLYEAKEIFKFYIGNNFKGEIDGFRTEGWNDRNNLQN